MDASGLYLHVPFCSAICPYCDFAVARGDAADRSRYVDALVADVAAQAPLAESAFAGGFDTIYFGGGTPSALKPEQLERILSAIRDRLPVRAAPGDVGPRIFLEANPEDVSLESLSAWRELGVATVSLGVQALDDRILKRLGRRHRTEEALAAIDRSVAAGFRTVSVDFMYGLDDQSIDEWLASLEPVLARGIDHLSCYQLTFHEETPFGRALEAGKLRELPEEGQAKFFRETHRFLAERGFPGYEVSNFARDPFHRSLHNQKYWSHTPYLGLGPSAHSFAENRRWWNHADWRTYASAIEAGESGEAGSERLDEGDLALEAVMLGLRTRAGVDLDRFRNRFGVDLELLNAAEIVTAEWIEVVDGALRCTERAWPVVDSVAASIRLD